MFDNYFEGNLKLQLSCDWTSWTHIVSTYKIGFGLGPGRDIKLSHMHSLCIQTARLSLCWRSWLKMTDLHCQLVRKIVKINYSVLRWRCMYHISLWIPPINPIRTRRGKGWGKIRHCAPSVFWFGTLNHWRNSWTFGVLTYSWPILLNLEPPLASWLSTCFRAYYCVLFLSSRLLPTDPACHRQDGTNSVAKNR